MFVTDYPLNALALIEKQKAELAAAPAQEPAAEPVVEQTPVEEETTYEDESYDYESEEYEEESEQEVAQEPAYATTQEVSVKYDPSDILIPRINDETRVYKGGSWNDRIYWLNPTTRRFKQQNESSATIGFRCAMSVLGKE